MSESKGNIQISDVQGNVSGVIAAGESQTMTGVAIGTISGNVTNAINQLDTISALNQSVLKTQLAQLQTAFESTPHLEDEDKVEALEQLIVLAETALNPGDQIAQKALKRAIKVLRGTIVDLSDETKLHKVCKQLLPMITDQLPLRETADNSTHPTKAILLLAANPKETSVLQLGEEARQLQIALERSRCRDQFVIHQRWAVTPTDVRRALLAVRPAIVHFSGHGIGREVTEQATPESRKIVVVNPPVTTEPEGLVFENEMGQQQLVSVKALSTLFSLFSDHIECVVLNSCFSAVQADTIVQHIPYVVGMKRAIADQAAIQFTQGFYDGILAGESIDFSYQLGCNAIQLAQLPGELTPILKKNNHLEFRQRILPVELH